MAAALLWLFISSATHAVVNWPTDPATGTYVPKTEMSMYLNIVTGYGDDFKAFDCSNCEEGANQELVSDGTVGGSAGTNGQRVGAFNAMTDLADVFIGLDGTAGNLGTQGPKGWTIRDGNNGTGYLDTVGTPDTLDGARPGYEGIDYSGNTAIIGDNQYYGLSNVDINATKGFNCAETASTCILNGGSLDLSVATFFEKDVPNPDKIDPNDPGYDPYDDTEQNMTAGTSQFGASDLQALKDELAGWRDFVVGLDADAVITSDSGFQFGDRGPSSMVTLDGDAIDSSSVNFSFTGLNNNIGGGGTSSGNNDGIAVIDIDVGDNTFLLNNIDLKLQTTGKGE
jgi:hypothetical protein